MPSYPDHDPENRCGRYILDRGGNPVPEPDLIKWGLWLERSYQDGTHWIAHDELRDGHFVSTVFLGVDHSFCEGEPPSLYETMAFNDYGSLDTEWNGERYATREEALAGHAAALSELKLRLVRL